MMKNEIIIYSTDELAEHIEVRIDEETVWLNQQQLAQLFQTDRSSIAKHLQNIYSTRELDENELYHFGVSFSDMGKKPVVSEAESWFAFSKMGVMTEII